jgi:hypothetical protein
MASRATRRAWPRGRLQARRTGGRDRHDRRGAAAPDFRDCSRRRLQRDRAGNWLAGVEEGGPALGARRARPPARRGPHRSGRGEGADRERPGRVADDQPQARSAGALDAQEAVARRITVTPEAREGVPGFRFQGEGTIRIALTGWFPAFPQAVASPTGTALLGLAAKPPKLQWMLPLPA